jgi:tripartite-type tricarboxylate transporter receptor subunit TctC
MFLRKLLRKLIAIAVLALVAIGAAFAESSYPSRPVQVVVAYPAGGGTDLLARLITAELSKELGQSFIVVNRPGASGAIGTDSVARAAPDGYTLLLDTGNITLRPAVDDKTRFRPKDFVPIALLTESACALVVTNSLPVSSLRELIEYSRAHPGKINYATTGQGSPQQLLGELLKKKANLDWVEVPYQGGAPALLDLDAGRVQVMFSNPVPLMPYLKRKRLKALAVTTGSRLPGLENVPTMAEEGQDDFVVSFWNGVLAPAGTPAPVVKKLSDALVKIMAMPKVRDTLIQQGSIIATLPADEFARYVNEDSARWNKIAQIIGIRSAQ